MVGGVAAAIVIIGIAASNEGGWFDLRVTLDHPQECDGGEHVVGVVHHHGLVEHLFTVTDPRKALVVFRLPNYFEVYNTIYKNTTIQEKAEISPLSSSK